MDIGDIQLCEVTESVWTSVLGLTVERGIGNDAMQGDQTIRACVHISGAWEGVVTVESTNGLARRAAAILLGVEEADATPEELSDTLGELTNIIGGNIKGLLPEPSRLSVPAVFQGSESNLTVKGSRLVSAVGFHCEGQPLRVALMRREPERG
jgi:chemotaxis protein CheX